MDDLFATYGDWTLPWVKDQQRLRRDFERVETLITAEEPNSPEAARFGVVRDRIAQQRRALIPGLNSRPTSAVP